MRLFPGALALLVCRLAAADPSIAVLPGQVLRQDADRWLGINLNYIRDADANRTPGARPLESALRDLGVRWLRYPGGEKSDFHRFASPPYAAAAPLALGWYASGASGQRMDFDAYIAYCRAVGAEPYVVVACDNAERTGATWDEQLAHAVAWVRYANVTKGYGVRHWEIGNENWHNTTAPPAEMAAIVTHFSAAMKVVDPAIRIGASGSDRAWWDAFLPAAAASLDFLSVSAYNAYGWRSYDRLLRAPEPDLLGPAGDALRAIDRLPAAERARLRVIVAETNSVDYHPEGWPRTNDLGHAIATFEILGRLLAEPRIDAALLWNTRWMKDEEAARDQFYALDATNALLPSGLAVALWGRHLRRDLVATSGATATLTAHACADDDGVTLWLVNRAREAVPGVALSFGREVGTVAVQALSGNGPEDPHPAVTPPTALAPRADGSWGVACPGVSISVIRAAARRP